MKHTIRLGMIEAQFADLIWQHEPITTRELVALCREALNWQRTTAYTVLKKLCLRGIFTVENQTVTSLISKSEFHAIQSEQFVNDNFQGSLPAFVAAFTARKTPSKEELEQLQQLINAFTETQK